MATRTENGFGSFTAGAAIAQFLRVKLTSGKLAVAGIADHEIGVIDAEAFADLDVRPVRLRTAPGTQIMVANQAITQYAPIYSAASGKVSDVVAGAMIGFALEASAADGDELECIYMPNAAVAAVHLIDPTDLPTCITRIAGILNILEGNGSMLAA